MKAIFSAGLATLLFVYAIFALQITVVTDLQPIDELDAACKEHDLRMLELDKLLEAGKITKREWKKLKNQGRFEIYEEGYSLRQ